jgi:hypothetical protein
MPPQACSRKALSRGNKLGRIVVFDHATLSGRERLHQLGAGLTLLVARWANRYLNLYHCFI